MKAFKVFVFGLLYGWFFKYAFDRIYRGNEMEDLQHENESLREYIRTLESRFQASSATPRAVAAPTPQPLREAEASPSQPVQSSESDNLKAIKGIGPAIEKRLNNAGIYTFRALAGLSVKELEGILGNARRLAREDDLIAQAKKLARQNHK